MTKRTPDPTRPSTFRWSVATPPNARGAVGIVSIDSDDLDAALDTLGIAPVGAGEVKLRDLLGVDRGLVARWSDHRADLFCHGGPGVMRALVERLGAHGGAHAASDPEARYPEARSLLEARMLAALADAASPRAVDLLLDQPRRWAPGDPAEVADERLDRLLRAPLVAAVGPPNIGKSTLLNGLAGRSVAIAADEPGTTRDHVGAVLELDGLAVRYLDLPGLDGSASGPDAEAQRLARAAARSADLVLLCRDAASPEVLDREAVRSDAAVLHVGLRSDLGAVAGVDVSVCAPRRVGLTELATAIRAALVPDAALSDPRPWRFWAT